MRIIVFWDSISEWFWDFEKWGWVNILKMYLWKKYWYEKMVMNFWIASYTSDNIVKYFQSFFEWCSKREEWKEKESIVIIAIWINDCSIDRINKIPRVNKEQFTKNINEIIDKCKNEELIKKIIFVSNINVDEKVSNDIWSWDFLYYNKNIELYNGIINDLCNKNKIEYIDLYWIMDLDDFEDWLHPNSKWHIKIFEKVKNYLDK